MLDQIKQFSLDNKIADFVKISENLSHFNNLTPKVCIKLWEGLKKNLKDIYKRENEFQTLCRNEVNIDFWTETINIFKKRVKMYEDKLKEERDIKLPLSEIKPVKDAISSYQNSEKRVSSMMETYFQLFNDPKKNIGI